MKPASLLRLRSSRLSNIPTRRRLLLETLENRSLLAGVTISITDAAATEGDNGTKSLGAFISSQPSGLNTPKGMTIHNGDLFVVSGGDSSVLRYGLSGNFLGTFVTPGSGGLDHAFDTVFGPDGNLYVSSTWTNNVMRYDGNTGAFLDEFVSAGSGGLNAPREIIFGPDQNLYVASQNSGEVLRYQGPQGPVPGAFMGAFASTGSDHGPFGLAFGPDGNLFVAVVPHGDGQVGSQTALGIGYVARYDGSTGAYIDTFVPTGRGGLKDARHLAFDPAGNLLLTEVNLNSVLRYEGPNGSNPGAFVDALVPPGSGGLAGPQDLVFDQDGNIEVASAGTNQILRFGAASQLGFTISLSAPCPTSVTVNYATANGSALAGSDYSTSFGTITFALGETSHTILVKSLDDATYEGNETFVVNLSSPIGATIADSQGVATISDDDIPPTKFYVADDNATNKTFEYAANGTAIENYAINSGNSAPRGAASTIAGDKVWVADANKNVYVYNTSGGLLGSWSAGSLASNADVQGITTNGTDIWIVDAKQDKVFKYTGAASRLSGTQTAASSFSLNSSNGDATDLVTDGTSIWVLNNSSTDKVFKYTVSGTLLGSWTITSGGGSPTGITIDPSSVSNIWIVDSSSDRIYEFSAATSRTSGSQSPSNSFALSATNTNPQGIADPPATLARSASEALGQPNHATSTNDSPHDAALLSLTQELSTLLASSKKRK